jgi:hypothetical protein
MPCISYVYAVCFCTVSFTCFQETIEDAMGRVHGIHRGRYMHTGFWWGNMNERGHMKDLCIDGKA